MLTADSESARGPDRVSGGAGGRRPLLVVLVLAGLTVALGVLVPLAPVTADEPVVSWPRAGAQPTSTVLPLAPYRPLRLDATVPCRTLRALDNRPGTLYALTTMPLGSDGADQGLSVSVDNGEIAVQASGVAVLTEQFPARDCEYRVLADSAGVRVSRDGEPVAAADGALVPQVAQLATDAQGTGEAGGLAVRLRTDDRYASQPSALKVLLLVAHLAALLATLVLGWRLWRGRGAGLARPRFGGADVTLLGVSLAWVVIAPMAYDDSWYLLMARAAEASGYVGNYVYMFNVTENPFVASQYLGQAWGWLGGWSLAWMRLLPLAYGLVTWVLLRVLLATALGRAARLRWVPWMLLVAHLVWWLPYGLTLRPEALVVPLAAGVLVLAELARRRRSVAALALGAALSALAVTAAPAGLIAAAPLATSLPWLLGWLRERSWTERITAAALLLAAATVAVPVAFGDATFGDVYSATQVHRWYYFTFHWYEEIVHFETLLVNGDAGPWGKRMPVALTLAVLGTTAIASGRRPRVGDPVQRLLHTSAITVAVALVLLALIPTKWVNHFGALAAAPTVLLAAALLRSPLPRRSGAVVSTTAVGVIIAAAGLSFAGPNLWRPFTDWGQPFGNHLGAGGTRYQLSLLAPHVGPIFLRNPLVWAVVAAVLAAGIALWRRRGRRTSLTTDRALLVTVTGLAVTMMLAVFVYAPIKHGPGWTVAGANIAALSGETCGLARAVEVLGPVGPPLGPPIGEAQLTADFTLGEGVLPSVRPPSRGEVWHDDVAARRSLVATERGGVVSGWYPLPPSSPATHVTVPVAGGTLEGHRLALEFGTGAGAALRPVDRVEPGLNTVLGENTWQEVAVPITGGAAQPGLGRPTAVRVVAQDAVRGPGSWLAVAEPTLTGWTSVRTVTEGRTTFADQLSAGLWPCVDQATISHAVTEAPEVRLRSDDGVGEVVLQNPTYVYWGGAFAQADRTATYVQMESRLPPEVPGTRNWGEVQRIRYDHPFGLVDLTVERNPRSGWTRYPPLTGADYSGRPYVG